jgi:hypothetical protein
MREDLADDAGIFDGVDDLQLTATLATLDIDVEDAFE